MKIVIDKKFEALADYISLLPSMMAAGRGEIVYDGRNQVARFREQDYVFMVKRFKRVNPIQKVVYSYFRKSKAERAYLFAEEFSKRGIDTPQRVAYMEENSVRLFDVGYFVSVEVPGTETSLLLREVQHYPPQLAQEVACQIVQMHSKGILHGDLNLSNFLCTEDAEGYHFTMIDINRSKFCVGFPSDEVCLKNLVRLTHRRDLYEDLIRRYANLRGWDVDSTVCKALSLLDMFENKKFRL